MAYERDKTRIDERAERDEIRLKQAGDQIEGEEGDAESEDSGVSSFLDRFFSPTDKRVR